MKGIVASIFVCLWAVEGQARTIKYHPRSITESNIQKLESDIIDSMESGDFHVTIDIDSDGGHVTGILGRSSASDGIAARVEALKGQGLRLTTRVSRGSVCMSSCTALFVIGDRRLAYSSSEFMFHGIGIRNVPRKEKERIQKIFADRWLDLISSVDPALASYLDRKNILLKSRGRGGNSNDWTIRARSLKSQFGNYITELL